MAHKNGESGPKLARMKTRKVATLDDEPPGTVLLVRDTGDFDHQYALKLIEPEEDKPVDAAAIARARATFEAAGKLNHRALVTVHDFRVKKKLFRTVGAELLMEAVDGKSLDQLDSAKVTVGQWVQVFREVAAALAQMHRRKVLHGNLSPSKILVSRGGRVKILGFGQTFDGSEAPANSKKYLAPERLKGAPPSERADLYGLGAVLYRCLTGKVANIGKRAEGDVEKISTPSALNPKVPAALNNLVVSCLQSHPPRRPAGAYEVQQALDELADTLKVDEDALAGLAAEPGADA
jgi:serine/threonine protein kinase